MANRKRRSSKRRKTFTGQQFLQTSRKLPNGKYRTKLGESRQADIEQSIRRSTIEIAEGLLKEDGTRIGRRVMECEQDTQLRSHSESVYIEFYNNRDNREQLLAILDQIGYAIPRERIRLTERGKRRLDPIVIHDAGKECSGIAILAIPADRLQLFLSLPYVRDVHHCKRPESAGTYQIRSRKYDKIESQPDDPTGRYPW